MSKFIVALFSHKLINDTSLQQMLTIKDGQGLGIEQFALNDELIYGHSGMNPPWILRRVKNAYTNEKSPESFIYKDFQGFFCSSG